MTTNTTTPTTITTSESALTHFITWGTTNLHMLYILGEAIKNDTTLAQVDADTQLTAWESELIKVLIVLRPLFSFIAGRFPMLQSLITWASNIYNELSAAGKIIATV